MTEMLRGARLAVGDLVDVNDSYPFPDLAGKGPFKVLSVRPHPHPDSCACGKYSRAHHEPTARCGPQIGESITIERWDGSTITKNGEAIIFAARFFDPVF